MIITVTPNSALDLTLIYDSLVLDQVQPAAVTALSTAGKAADAAFVLGALGIPCLATGFIAGTFGKKLVGMLESRGVITDFVEVEGETRINTFVIDRLAKTTTTLTSDSLIVLPSDEEKLLRKIRALARFSGPLVTGGSLPAGVQPEFYACLIRFAKKQHLPVIFDGSGENLVAGLPERPDVIKPNQDELSAFVGREIRDSKDALAAARSIFEKQGVAVVATLGKDGAVAVFNEGDYRLFPLAVESIVSAAGAGDAILAGLAVALDSQRPLVEGLILGAAAAAAVLLTPGTADCRKADVLRLLSEVQIEKISERS